MLRQTKVLYGIFFLGVLLYVNKNSSSRSKKLILSLNVAYLICFTNISLAEAKNFAADGFSAPINRVSRPRPTSVRKVSPAQAKRSTPSRMRNSPKATKIYKPVKSQFRTKTKGRSGSGGSG